MTRELSAVAALVLILALLPGCASHPPTIAHTHLGHAITSWVDTPGKKGLLVVAEDSAQRALDAAQHAASPDADLATIKGWVHKAVDATTPPEADPGDPPNYGVLNALQGAVDHVQFAAESDDASANVRAGAAPFARNAHGVIERCELVGALGGDILGSSSREVASQLSGELVKLTRANIFGEDSDGDGVIGSTPQEYGLRQLRSELQGVIDREDPPYTTVDTWYLLNLIRLPSGKWIFRQHTDAAGASRGGY